jgi:chloramphenicol 3-O phosphotransferase
MSMEGAGSPALRGERSLPSPHVIILNGVSSVGKSSTARALQAITAEPFMHVAMDAFLEMLPAGMFGNPEGYVFETVVDDEGKPCVIIRTGSVLERAMKGMRHAIAAMAGQGINLVVDDVMFGQGEAREYRALLSRFDLRFVGLFAPLEVVEARERARGDRDLGLARWQHDRVHREVTYDLEIDTMASTPAENARRICDAFGL